ncbi:hypothetical protein H6764_01870 [Candidatus Nomurabacteria bacterium]|nr:hypothetical protein [Candidatus Nomurabacteria bacterium]
MKLFFSEFTADYESYSYPYQVCGVKEPKDTLKLIYDNGFLPTRIDKRLFYLCRSFRVDLRKFKLSSENRRIQKRNSSLSLEVHRLKNFTYSYEIGKLAKDFYTEKFGPKTMSAQKAKWLFTSGAMTDVIEYKTDGYIVGYCLVNKTKKILHYAYPFYKLELNNSNLGMGMMLQAIVYAKEKGLRYAYLGTVYTEASLYKTQFEGGQFFNGRAWDSDISLLKEIVRNKKTTGHTFGELKNKSDAIDAILK